MSCAAMPPGSRSGSARCRRTASICRPKEFADFGFDPVEWTDFDVAMIYLGRWRGRFSHYSNELNNAKLLGLYEDFACREQAFYRDDVEATAVSRNAFTIE